MDNLFSGSDLILLGVIFAFLASIILVKDSIFKNPRVRRREAAAVYGVNPFLIKRSIVKGVMIHIAIFASIVTTLLTIVGIFMNVNDIGGSSYFLSSIGRLSVFFALGFFLIFISCKGANHYSKKLFLPGLTNSTKEGFDAAIFVTEHDGMERRRVEEGVELTRQQRDESLKLAKDRLETLALLFDIKYEKSDIDYVKIKKRLKAIFEKYCLVYQAVAT